MFMHFGFTGFVTSLHGITFVMIGITLASSSGNMLFNRDEADVLLHRPINARALLAAKVRVIVQVSLGMAVALNLCGLVIGTTLKGSNWLFIPAHLLSVTVEVIFCASFVALTYNLCLRCFGRERLENLMTTVQMVVAVGSMIAGQIVPHFVRQMDHSTLASPPAWVVALPPFWFAALDTVLIGHNFSPAILMLASVGLIATLLTGWVGVSWMASTYEQGLVTLNEAGPNAVKRGGRRGQWIVGIINLPLVRLWLRDPVERAAFRLAVVQLTRARGVKLRVYPMLAQFMVMPVVFIYSAMGDGRMIISATPFVLAFSGAFVAMLPVMILDILRMAEDWHAADLFRQTPLPRAAALFHGTRKAVILLVSVPALLLIVIGGVVLLKEPDLLLLLLAGIVAMPAFSMLPGLGPLFLPFAQEPEAQIHKPRGCFVLFLTMSVCGMLAGITGWAWMSDLYPWAIGIEIVLATLTARAMSAAIDRRCRNLTLQE